MTKINKIGLALLLSLIIGDLISVGMDNIGTGQTIFAIFNFIVMVIGTILLTHE